MQAGYKWNMPLHIQYREIPYQMFQPSFSRSPPRLPHLQGPIAVSYMCLLDAYYQYEVRVDTVTIQLGHFALTMGRVRHLI